MNTPGQKALWEALFPGSPTPQYAHMSVTVSDTGGKLSKRERPQTLRTALEKDAGASISRSSPPWAGSRPRSCGRSSEADTTPDIPAIEAMAEHLGVRLPEINIVDFFRSGYLPETMVNFLALLGWNPGDQREIMTVEELDPLLRPVAPDEKQQPVRPQEAPGVQHGAPADRAAARRSCSTSRPS